MSPATGAVPPAAAPAGEVVSGTVLLHGRYELGGLLGRGASAKVYLARDVLMGRSVAIKSFPNPGAPPAGRGSDRIEREAAILRRLRHRHVVRLHEILATRRKVHFVLDLAAGGELFSLVDASGRVTEGLARRYFRQLVSAVRYCHARGVFHRDIKPENLLLDDGDLKVADFGLGAVADGDPRRTLCGTPAYVAPEMLLFLSSTGTKTKDEGYDPAKVDVWSCGVVLFVLAAGYLPFNDASLVNMYRKIHAARFRCPSWFSPALRDLLRRILHPDPATRIDTDGIVRHPWFRDGASDDDLVRLMRSGHEELEEEEDVAWFFNKPETERSKDEEEGMTAFDILTFSSGTDLSAMLGAGPGKERVFVSEHAAAVLRRVEEAARKEGYRVRKRTREGKSKSTATGLVYVEEESGDMVAKVAVFKIADTLSVVEVVMGDGAEAALFWKDRLRPAVKPPAGA